ncbi:coagulation factor XIII A chain-like [Petromyzon marinus]|uniref:coagulation factor XIII A chain-like n=1 Tax=Petromyzon marinus TaxID=7757 RepID=UPI003F71A15A
MSSAHGLVPSPTSTSTWTDAGRWSASRIAARAALSSDCTGGAVEAAAAARRVAMDIRPLKPSWPWHLAGSDFPGNDPGVGRRRHLAVLSVDQLIAANRARHRTSDYEVDNLVLRRGEPFDLQLKLNRPYDPIRDKIRLELQIGRFPLESRGSLVVAEVSGWNSESRFGATVSRCSGNELTISMNLAPNCIVGRFEMYVVTESDGQPNRTRRDPNTDTYVLFNPWCREDQVFMSDESWRREYVLNDTGCLYLGTSQQIVTQHWNFGQFERGILDVCLSLLDKGDLGMSFRGSPIAVSRTTSAILNANDDNGVLMGRWSGNYRNGVPPTAWNGSVDILLRYGRVGRPVRYGQCWVFSGLLTTVLRCLGIPCRSISNFSSMHDQNANLTMDTYLDQDMWPIDSLNHDSIWNFHVWNEAWMARPDLPGDNGGWQIVDATPQEQSNGLMQCGPAPQVAVKNGHVHIKHDTPFVFAEVNGDRVYWVWGKDWRFHKVYTDTSVIGKDISTKAVGSMRREDITLQYKFPEGSREERDTMALALAGGIDFVPYSPSTSGDAARRVPSPASPPASPAAADDAVAVERRLGPGDLALSFAIGDAAVGSDFAVRVRVANGKGTAATATVTVHVQGDFASYTGASRQRFKRDRATAVLEPGETGELEFPVLVSDYLLHLSEHGTMNFTASARVEETENVVTKVRAVSLRAPTIDIAARGEARVDTEMHAELTFKNPLPVCLTDVSFNMEGPSLLIPTIRTFRNINAGESVSLSQSFTPTKAGERTLMASLQCKELYIVTGTLELAVSGRAVAADQAL